MLIDFAELYTTCVREVQHPQPASPVTARLPMPPNQSTAAKRARTEG